MRELRHPRSPAGQPQRPAPAGSGWWDSPILSPAVRALFPPQVQKKELITGAAFEGPTPAWAYRNTKVDKTKSALEDASLLGGPVAMGSHLARWGMDPESLTPRDAAWSSLDAVPGVTAAKALGGLCGAAGILMRPEALTQKLSEWLMNNPGKRKIEVPETNLEHLMYLPGVGVIGDLPTERWQLTPRGETALSWGREGGGTGPLSDFFDMPGLEQSQVGQELLQYPTSIKTLPLDTLGQHDPHNRALEIARGLKGENPLRTVRHELEHAVQTAQNFPGTGQSGATAADQMLVQSANLAGMVSDPSLSPRIEGLFDRSALLRQYQAAMEQADGFPEAKELLRRSQMAPKGTPRAMPRSDAVYPTIPMLGAEESGKSVRELELGLRQLYASDPRRLQGLHDKISRQIYEGDLGEIFAQAGEFPNFHGWWGNAIDTPLAAATKPWGRSIVPAFSAEDLMQLPKDLPWAFQVRPR